MSCSIIKTGGSMRRIIVAVLLLFFLGEAIPGTKKEFWEEKDYKQWSARECSNILNNSPWTQSLIESIPEYGGVQKKPGASSDDSGTPVQIPVTKTVKAKVQLQSALPVRQALVRQDQILGKYNSLSPEQKMAFDQNAETLLSPSSYSDKIVITLIYSDKIAITQRVDGKVKYGGALVNKLAFLSGSSGKKVQPLSFKPEEPKTQIQMFKFIFPREVEGHPVIDSQDKELIFECQFGGSSKQIRFNLKKMMINGEPQY
jgi:hypothetical protein